MYRYNIIVRTEIVCVYLKIAVQYEMIFIVDIQGFKISQNKFVIKEFAMISEHYSSTFKPIHYIVKSPFSLDEQSQLNYRQTNTIKWLTKNCHGLSWNGGNVSISQLKRILHMAMLEKSYRKIFFKAKGHEKCLWLSDFFVDLFGRDKNVLVLNIEMDGIIWPTLSSMRLIHPQYKQCSSHSSSNKKNYTSLNCALQNVYIMRNHLRKHTPKLTL